MAAQQILFTVMPRGITQGAGPLPVSVSVSPRLTGADRLDAFPDWRRWTALVQHGFQLTFLCGGRELTLPIDGAPLRPGLWDAMFDDATYVRSHAFTDYADRAIHSYPVRYALSTLKSMYQRAGVELALPDQTPPGKGEQHASHHRRLVGELVDGLAVNWDEERGERMRKHYQGIFGSPYGFWPREYNASELGADGLLRTMPPPAADKFFRQRMTEQFAIVNHVPPGQPIKKENVDFEKLIDFHQALSSLNSYPALLRALGLVFDFELPADFLATTGGVLGVLSVSGVSGWQWQLQDTLVPPQLPALETSYFLVPNPAQQTFLFGTTPSGLAQLSPRLDTFGLLNLAPTLYGIAQVDVDGALHKAIIVAESWQDGRLHQAVADNPEVFDPSATLPSLRSGGLSIFADARALKLLDRFKQSKTFNDALAANKAARFHAEDLIHGYRLDVWDSHTDVWHSLHQRTGVYRIGGDAGQEFATEAEEGFTQLAATQAAPDPTHPPDKDLYLHEAVARWAGWSLSVPMPGRALSSDADPDKALEDEAKNEPATPFKMTTEYHAVRGSLPSLRFGRRYRLRARVVDICGNSLAVGDPLTGAISASGFVLPADPEGIAYVRYEPVVAPIVVVRDARALTDHGSSIDRLVIRTVNSDPSLDGSAANVDAAERHLVPPRTSVDTAERLSMFDDASGKLVTTAAMYDLIAQRDKGELNQVEMAVSGHSQAFPLEASAQIDPLPYLPDALARGVALRDLPGTADGTVGEVSPEDDPGGVLQYRPLVDPNPRAGSATLVSFGGRDDWQRMLSLRLALAEAGGGHSLPEWDGGSRVLTVFLPKAASAVIPLSSYLTPDDLKLMGVWQWVREYIDTIARQPDEGFLGRGDVDLIAHVLQRAVEGGHWLITPPRLLTLVHAVQQPIGHPAFCAIAVQHEPYGDPSKSPFDETRSPSPEVLQTTPEKPPTADTELAAITAWRKPGAVDAFLLGGLQVHGASTEKVDILAEWTDPVDDVTTPRSSSDPNREARSAHVDEVPIRTLRDGLLVVKEGTPNERAVGYYDADHDLLCFLRAGDRLGNLLSPDTTFSTTVTRNAAPRHHLNDTKHHRITYTAIAASRFREYFAPDQAGGFTRPSEPVVVDVPASTRPKAPQIAYVVPTFGWQRHTETNVKRSVRFGGGLRIYLERPWYSSGDGELLGVSLYDYNNGTTIDRDKWKCHVTQWGADPIWATAPLLQVPGISNCPDCTASEQSVSLESPAPGRADVAGYPVAFDDERQLWFADITLNTATPTYAPFVRLALVRYQPRAIPDAKMSRVVVADFAQLTPSRAAVVTADPYHARRLRVTVSGVAPSGPVPVIMGPQPTAPVKEPTVVSITVQRRQEDIPTDLGWEDVAAGVATVSKDNPPPGTPLVRWTGTVQFADRVVPGQFRLLIAEHEYLSANYVETDGRTRVNPGRLIYAETMALDEALIGGPPVPTGTVV